MKEELKYICTAQKLVHREMEVRKRWEKEAEELKRQLTNTN